MQALFIWDYSEEGLTNNPEVQFVLHAADVLPPSWLPKTNFGLNHSQLSMHSTNLVNGTNLVTMTFPLTIETGQKFYSITASNRWGESVFSDPYWVKGVAPVGWNLRLEPIARPTAARPLTAAQRREAIERANRAPRPPVPR